MYNQVIDYVSKKAIHVLVFEGKDVIEGAKKILEFVDPRRVDG